MTGTQYECTLLVMKGSNIKEKPHFTALLPFKNRFFSPELETRNYFLHLTIYAYKKCTGNTIFSELQDLLPDDLLTGENGSVKADIH